MIRPNIGDPLPGTPVNLSMAAVGVGALLLAAFLFGGGDARRPLRRSKKATRRTASGSSGGGGSNAVDDDVISALQNLGYSKAVSGKAVAGARRKGKTGFDAIFSAAQRSLE